MERGSAIRSGYVAENKNIQWQEIFAQNLHIKQSRPTLYKKDFFNTHASSANKVRFTSLQFCIFILSTEEEMKKQQ
jgi:hypothetical protein